MEKTSALKVDQNRSQNKMPLHNNPNYFVSGRIRDEQNRPVEGYNVQSFDKASGIELHPDDRLGKSRTDSDGYFEMTFNKDVFKDWFQNNPNIYIQIRDREGRVVVETHQKINTTGDVYFQVKLGQTDTNPLAPNIYANNLRRLVADFRIITEISDESKDDVKVISELLLRTLGSWAFYRDQMAGAGGYDGIQVPAEPRKIAHYHVTRWDRAELLI